MRIGRPISPLRLTEDGRATLERWARRPTTAQALAQRPQIILGCAADETKKQTVGKWRSRFLAKRVAALLDEPRPGAPRTVSDAQVDAVVTLALEGKPRDASHWSTRAMAARSGLSQSTVPRIRRAFGLQPHRTETFKVSPDPLFVEKVRDIVGLYLDPPERALVLSVKSPDPGPRSHPTPAANASWAARTATHDYVRHGTTSLSSPSKGSAARS